MSLSQEPAHSALKNYFVCGWHDISNESYAGMSGRHDDFGNAVNTTNGAGPHNIQIFLLAADGTVLHCLPGYWHSKDLVHELSFAYQLNKVYCDPKLNQGQKQQMFKAMHLNHFSEHPPQMVRRSRMQGFDQQYEAEHRPTTSDAIKDVRLVMASPGKAPGHAFKTTDQLMHERMAKRPFLRYERFDVATYSDYGRPFYDKHEDAMDHRGRVNMEAAHNLPKIGTPKERKEEHSNNEPRGWGQYTPSQSAGWGNRN